jgi:hypothetical protein
VPLRLSSAEAVSLHLSGVTVSALKSEF